MELNELPQMDPRALKATSVKARRRTRQFSRTASTENHRRQLEPKDVHAALAQALGHWPEDLLANLPRGISRHVVRFVHVGDEVYAMKEITPRWPSESTRSCVDCRSSNCQL